MESVEALPSPSSLTSLLALLGPVLFLHQTLLIDEEVEFSVGLRMRQSSTQKEEEEQGEEEGGGKLIGTPLSPHSLPLALFTAPALFTHTQP